MRGFPGIISMLAAAKAPSMSEIIAGGGNRGHEPSNCTRHLAQHSHHHIRLARGSGHPQSGVARGIVVRARLVVDTSGASLQTIVGGNTSLFSKLCEQTRADSFDLMLQHAAELGANAIVGAR